jgi:hypothetical protein
MISLVVISGDLDMSMVDQEYVSSIVLMDGS